MKKIFISFTVLSILFFTSCSNEEKLDVSVIAQSDQELHTLPDGSKVWLKKGTEIKHGKNIVSKNGERVVDIKGEAYFDIERDPDNPFVIKAGESELKTNDASLNVVSYDGENVNVSVQEGDATFNADGKSVKIKQGTAIAYNAKTKQIESKDGGSLNAFAWMTRKLVFKDTELQEIAKDLNKFYEVQTSIANEAIKQCNFTGTFEKAELNEVLEIMSISMNIEYDLDQAAKDLSFDGQGCD